MKYGYMFYQKPLKPQMKSRPVNLGDPIQSYAVKNLYREMGIPEEDIIPVPRYDISTYDGEECVCVVNSASNYEELAYDSHFMPPSKKVHALPMSLHLHRKLPDDELEFYRTCGGVGCRDLSTVEYLRDLGVDAYLTGCLTLTLPRRTEEQAKKANKIYFLDVPADVMKIIPQEIKDEAVILSNILRFDNPGKSNRISVEDAYEEHRKGEERVALLRDTAKLVITSKLHVASPCLAMGIPVILAKNHFGDRFGFIDRLIPTYTPEYYSEINWNPKPVDFEEDKAKIKQVFFNRVKAAVSRVELEKMWEGKNPVYDIDYNTATSIAVKKIPFPEDEFEYAVWGIVLSAAFYLDEAMRTYLPNGKLIAGIDIAAEGIYCGVNIIKPEDIKSLPEDAVIIVAAPSAQESAKKMLLELNRPFVLLKGTNAEWYNME
ncbi:MAG: polysaccharide pyruvyl transferase family protein [Bacillota bacterium]|nr:polysaccharide pyruvyl transferase family protein [Bacillota bacterium]